VVDLTTDIITKLLDYGIAGIVIVLLFKLIFNDLNATKQLLQQLVSELQALRGEVRELRATMEEVLRALKSSK
jgi:archaellum component FlaC